MKFWQVLSFSEPGQLVELAAAAEQAGFHGVLLSDHLFFPGRLESKYPYSEDGKPGFDGSAPFPDPWTAIAAMSQAARRLHFSTLVFILPLREPLQLAKTLGTLALLTGGRVILGAGAGWVREEFDTLGIPFETRGRRMSEMVQVLRLLWRGEMAGHHGEHFDFAPLQMSPAPGCEIPIYFGGISDAALRRAASLGDGWFGTGQTPEQAAALLDRLDAALREAGRANAPFERIVPLSVPLEPDLLRRLEAEHGLTGATCWPFHYTLGPGATLQQKRDWMLRFGEEVIAQFR